MSRMHNIVLILAIIAFILVILFDSASSVAKPR